MGLWKEGRCEIKPPTRVAEKTLGSPFSARQGEEFKRRPVIQLHGCRDQVPRDLDLIRVMALPDR